VLDVQRWAFSVAEKKAWIDNRPKPSQNFYPAGAV